MTGSIPKPRRCSTAWSRACRQAASCSGQLPSGISARWGSKTYYTQLRLDPLPPVSADELLQALLGDDPGLVPLKRLLIARTDGNPFFLEESVRTLVETGVLVGESGADRLVKPLDSLQVPATVQAVLAARIDRLPSEEKGSSRPLRSSAPRCPGPCCRPSPGYPGRRCTATWRISRPPSSSTRRGSFPTTSTLSSTPSPTRWPTAASCRKRRWALHGPHCRGPQGARRGLGV